MAWRNKSIIRSIRTSTKVGALEVGDGCNESIDVFPGRYGLRNKVQLRLNLNHRSDDIEASANLAMTPEEARALASSLSKAADQVEESMDRRS
jgi:hypothetical protein